jgi:hypothetical protein
MNWRIDLNIVAEQEDNHVLAEQERVLVVVSHSRFFSTLTLVLHLPAAASSFTQRLQHELHQCCIFKPSL